MERESDFRAWDEMPPDLLGLIFKNLLCYEVLGVIPLVCKSWCKVVEGPYCWNKIDTAKLCGRKSKMERMLRVLIPRSAGSLLELSASRVDDQMLSFIAHHAGSLQTLILDECTLSDAVVEQVAPKLSSLTTLEIRDCDISPRALQAVGKNCRMLMSFSWSDGYEADDHLYSKEVAPAISQTMPKLKRLTLWGFEINHSDVVSILSGCPELELLHIRHCWGATLDGKILNENYPKVKMEGPDAL